ncbi:MAG: ATP-binding protein [Pseudobdellovibrionaceae bacterium]
MSPLDFQVVFKSLPYPIAILSPDLQVLDCNSNYQSLVGENILGQAVLAIFPKLFIENKKNQELEMSFAKAVFDKAKAQVSSLKIGGQFFTSVLTPILSQSGGIQYVLHSFEDCSQMERCQEELDVFCSTISHDLQAPLRNLSSFNQILIERFVQALDPQALHFLNRISYATNRMSLQIEGLVQFTRLGRQEINRRSISLSEIVEGQIHKLKKNLPAKKFEIKCAENVMVVADSELLKVAVAQLLSNAFKFSRCKEVSQIEFGVHNIESDRVFYIRDNGDGFSMDYAKKLFGFFQRLHSEEFEGVGMGLAITQRIIQSHGGRIWAESDPAQGSTFYFTLGS